MFRVEVGKALHRPRTYVLAALLAAVAVLPIVVFATSSSASGGPAFFDFLRRSGLFGPLAALAVMQPFILPLGAGLLSGEAIAAEASSGTLRYLLARPVPRVRLVLEKYAAVIALLGLAVLWILLVGLVAGVIAFGLKALPTLSGSTIAVGSAAVRIVVSALYVLASIAGLAAIGILISCLTDSAPIATVATVAIVILFQLLDGLSSLHAIHPLLLTHHWLAYVDLFRSPVVWDGIVRGAIAFSAYTAIFLSAAVFWFRRKDITS